MYTVKKCSLLLFVFAITLSFSYSAQAAKPKKDGISPTTSRLGVYQGYSAQNYNGYSYTSYYINMHDSTPLAVDVYLPKGLEKGKKVPAILYLTRYVRSIHAKFPLNLLRDPIFGVVTQKEVEFFTSYGYACVIVDVRGTGASLGDRKMEFSPEEIADGKDIVDWIIAQPWCDKQVGTTGVSYLGTTAEMLLANQHPNVKACIPRSAIFDLYKNIIFPGGVCQGPFVDVWGLTTRSLDKNDFSPLSKQANLVTGIHKVDGDAKNEMLNKAIELHKSNFDITVGLQQIKFRNDKTGDMPLCSDDCSVHTRLSKISTSGTAIYRIGGWYDGGLARGSLDASLNTENTKKVLIGPWDHGPHANVSPFATTKDLNLDVKIEMLRFFDHYLKGIDNGIDGEPKYTYYTIGEETWKSSNSWPPKSNAALTVYFSADKNLVTTKDKIKGGDVNYHVDYTATSDSTSRWNSVTALYKHGPTNYADRRKEDTKLLSYTSDVLSEPTEMTGHPVINLNFAANADDATVFVYLEDVGPDSSVTYITEGMMRPLDRKEATNAAYKTAYPDHTYRKEDALPYKSGETVQLTFDLLPISYQFRKGHRIRISIAGADAGHFNLPSPQPSEFKISSAAGAPSYVQLPVSGN
jgi:putative CocE/NonD family hydrolase